MNKIKLFILLVGIMSVFIARTQQIPFYNHYVINPVVINPATAGASGDLNAYLTRGQRYMGFESGAINNTLSMEGKFAIPNSGFGILVSQQSIGLHDQLSAQLSYAYHVKFNKLNDLSFGLSAGYIDNRFRLEEINVLHQSDPYLMGMKSYRPTYDFNLGVKYRWDKLSVGLSVPQLIGNKVKFAKENTRGYYSLARHFMGSASYELKFASLPKLTIAPQGLVRFVVGAPVQYDLTAHADYEDIGWFSLTYKSDYAIQVNLGFHILKDLHVGYSYEYITGSFKNNYSGVNHEFLLGYTFKSGKSRKVVRRIEVEVPVEDPKLRKENEELKRKLKEKEEELRKRLKELEETQNQDESPRPEETEEVEEPKKVVEEEQVEDEEFVIPNEAFEENLDFRDGSNYHFVEADGSDSPAGYYVVIGVFSDDGNVNKNIRRLKGLFPGAYYVKNQKNTYDYVVIKYTLSKQKAYKALLKYRNETQKDVWILKYKMD
ncbi:hypothetical protein CW751_12795 [Brumimicrobium salinarum]|uniref:SPOR domain-containing protein n=1 Tax=Brumimicrobium salinarum TaxID=2058658 RepID=A0A2I0QZT3_9FLAO|nr:PorP/SprF family type IX secretion system membrane protein [Brumimicrobium salinarum]PKR79829.1 hypothetical protein CW751_12795 [Brumimicrobium salinarum]